MPGEARRFFRPELDILRFVAFLAVFYHHAIPPAFFIWVEHKGHKGLAAWLLSASLAGSFGVDLFFVLSAYLITALLLRERAEGGRVRVLSFYARRALRIWPLYFTFLALCFFVVPRILPQDALPLRFLAGFALFVGNWACVAWNYPSSVAAPLWSVSVEEQFYLFWPLVLSTIPRKGLPFVGLGLVALAEATRLALVLGDARYIKFWCNTLVHLDPIVAGAAIAVLTERREFTLHWLLRPPLALLGIAVWVFACLHGTLENWPSLWTYPAITVGSCGLFLSFLGAGREGTDSPARSVLAYLGRISYGLYVFHVFAITYVKSLTRSEPLRVPLALGLTVGIAALSYRLLEQPFLRLKRRFTVVPSGAAS